MAISIDQRDLKILQILASEGRISKTALAARVNLSATACWERLRRLEKEGLVCGYHAEIALAKIVPHVSIFVLVELETHRDGDFQRFERAVRHYEEITACWALGGGFDYLLQVVARDIDSYQSMIDDLLARKVGLKRYFTYIRTKTVKSSALPPLGMLMDQAKK